MSLLEEISFTIWEPEIVRCVRKVQIRGRFRFPLAVPLLLAPSCGKITSFARKGKQLNSNIKKESTEQIQAIISSVRSKRDEWQGRDSSST